MVMKFFFSLGSILVLIGNICFMFSVCWVLGIIYFILFRVFVFYVVFGIEFRFFFLLIGFYWDDNSYRCYFIVGFLVMGVLVISGFI